MDDSKRSSAPRGLVIPPYISLEALRIRLTINALLTLTLKLVACLTGLQS